MSTTPAETEQERKNRIHAEWMEKQREEYKVRRVQEEIERKMMDEMSEVDRKSYLREKCRAAYTICMNDAERSMIEYEAEGDEKRYKSAKERYTRFYNDILELDGHPRQDKKKRAKKGSVL